MTSVGDGEVLAPSFDHREPGTDEDVWRGAAQWAGVRRRGPAAVLAGVHHLVVVAAHPDDETLGCAGLVAAASAGGVRVEVVVATLGEGSHPGSPTHPPARLAALREEEVRRAVAEVAARAQVAVLGLPDGGLEGAEEELAEALSRRTGRPGTLVLAPWRHDGHCDHEASGRVAARVAREAGARLLEYPVWLWHWGRPGTAPWDRLLAVDLTAEQQSARRAALAMHASQTGPLSGEPGDEVLLGPHVLAHFDRPFETYLQEDA